MRSGRGAWLVTCSHLTGNRHLDQALGAGMQQRLPQSLKAKRQARPSLSVTWDPRGRPSNTSSPVYLPAWDLRGFLLQAGHRRKNLQLKPSLTVIGSSWLGGLRENLPHLLPSVSLSHEGCI